ncbi:hypothetical protein AVW09_08390 [Microbacterium sp. T32]|nr:hypothetical protein AVW09_08390 [Microbacterium sp. T32]
MRPRQEENSGGRRVVVAAISTMMKRITQRVATSALCIISLLAQIAAAMVPGTCASHVPAWRECPTA